MRYLARKIIRSKWDSPEYSADSNDIRADAITACLRTHNDTLSFWQCASTEADIKEVALAIASSMDRLETMHIVLLNDTYLEKVFVFKRTEGLTAVIDLRGRHIDIVKLTVNKICALAEFIAFNVRSNLNVHRFNKK